MENKNQINKYPAEDPVGIDVYEEVFGELKQKPLVGLREFTINHLFANIWSRSSKKHRTEEKRSISMMERSMITVALLASQGRNEELKDHTKAARHLGITKEQLLEVMIHVAHYAGWPAGHFGQQIVLEIFDSNKIEEELKELNQKIGEAEKRGDQGFFQNILADELIFTMTNGSVITKQQFLFGLKPDLFDLLITDVQQVKIHGDYAVVLVNVTAKRKTEEFKSEYLNIRSFVKRNGDWKLATWLNTKILR